LDNKTTTGAIVVVITVLPLFIVTVFGVVVTVLFLFVITTAPLG
jgi:multisubunit Na+/H+ antiporter MnhG subunit